jgi:branched-chain amino acid transport system substrate-binding protein
MPESEQHPPGRDDMRRFTRVASLCAGLCAALLCGGGALAQTKTIKIGVLTDMTGLYAGLGGPGAVLATQMAVEDSGLAQKGWKIEVISGNHQNKADIGAELVRQWFDVDKVDLIIDVPNSAVALAVNQVVKERNKVLIVNGAASSDLTGKACTPNTVHWAFDTNMLANGTGTALTKSGGSTWFFVTADYSFGQALERDTSAAIKKAGGSIIGSVRHPLNTPDFSSFLLQAQSSGAKVIGLANGGGDAANANKQASEFGITAGGQKLAGLLLFIEDIHAIGLPIAKGLILTSPFYWDMNEKTREFGERYSKRMKDGSMPAMTHAGDYASLRHYFKAVEALGDAGDGAKVVAKMKEMPTDDPLFGKGQVRADGLAIHPAYLFEVKTPEESKKPWDYYKLIATIPPEEAFLPMSESGCPLVK